MRFLAICCSVLLVICEPSAPAEIAGFAAPAEGHHVTGASLRPPYTATLSVCASTCLKSEQCLGFNFDSATLCEPVGWSANYTLQPAPQSTAFYFKLVELDRKPVVPKVSYRLLTPVNNVVLRPGLFLDGFIRNVQYLNQFSVDDMLYWFRTRAGHKNVPGQSWGWDNGAVDAPFGLRGSVAGMFMMGSGGVVRWYNRSGLDDRLAAVVNNITELQEADGYAMAFPREDVISRENPNYVTSWVTHGMLEAYYSGHAQAAETLRKHFDWFNSNDTLPRMLPPRGGANIPGLPFQNRKDPQFTAGHLVYLIYQGIIHSTRMALVPGHGTQQDVKTVLRYQETWWLEQVRIAHDCTKSHMFAACRHYDPHNYEVTAMEAYFDMYMITGEQLYLDAVDGFWTIFRDHWLHVGGSVAIKEWLLYPPGSYYLIATGENPKGKNVYSTGELCGNAFWIKLNQRIHRYRPYVEDYVAEMERSLLNVVIANIVPSGAGIRQFALLHKMKMAPSNVSTCCEGQGTRILGSLPEYVCSVEQSTGNLVVDLYTPATCSYLTKPRYELTIDTKWPYDAAVSMRIHSLAVPQTFTVSMRVPSWVAQASIDVRVGSDHYNGKRGTYLNITRKWHNNDNVTFSLDAQLSSTLYTGLTQIKPFKRYAFEYGPVLLAVTGPWNSTIDSIHVPGVDGASPQDWMVPASTPLHWTVRGNPGLLVMPYFEVQDQLFEVYPVFDNSQM